MCSSDHVNPVRLAFRTFLVKELINRVINRLVLDNDRHELKKASCEEQENHVWKYFSILCQLALID